MNLYDVAKAAGVTRTVVSLVINGKAALIVPAGVVVGPVPTPGTNSGC